MRADEWKITGIETRCRPGSGAWVYITIVDRRGENPDAWRIEIGVNRHGNLGSVRAERKGEGWESFGYNGEGVPDVLKKIGVDRAYLMAVVDVAWFTKSIQSTIYEEALKAGPREDHYWFLNQAFLDRQRRFRDRRAYARALGKSIYRNQCNRKTLKAKIGATEKVMPPLPRKTLSYEQVRRRYRGQPGIYVVFGEKGECSYVGKSKDISARVADRFPNQSRWIIIPLPEPCIHLAEMFYIWFFNPKGNAEHSPFESTVRLGPYGNNEARTTMLAEVGG